MVGNISSGASSAVQPLLEVHETCVHESEESDESMTSENEEFFNDYSVFAINSM